MNLKFPVGTLIPLLFFCIVYAAGEEARFNEDPDQTIDQGLPVQSLAVADVDDDGYLDIAVGTLEGRNKIYFNRKGVLIEIPGWESLEIDNTSAVAWGDFDNDGDLDLACGNGGATTTQERNRIYLNQSGYLETSASWVSSNETRTSGLAWGDFDKDGDLDLACADRFSGITIYVNYGGILERMPSWTSSGVDDARAVAWCDYDGDGDLDLAVAVFRGYNKIYECSSGELETVASWVSVDKRNTTALAWGDIDGDGDFDLACGNVEEPICIYFNQGGTIETDAGWLSTDSSAATTSLVLGCLGPDNRLDLGLGYNHLIYSHMEWQPGIDLYMNGTGPYGDTPDWTTHFNQNVLSMILGDIDHDNNLDIVSGGEEGTIQVFYNCTRLASGQGILSYSGAERDESLAWADYDNDGDFDIAAGEAGFSGGYVRLFDNESGTFDETPDWELTHHKIHRDIVWGDTDNDGFPEIITGFSSQNPYYEDARSMLVDNQSGILDAAPSWQAHEYRETNKVSLGDYDNDGDLDLACATGLYTLLWTLWGVQSNVVYLNDNGKLDTLAGWESADADLSTDVQWIDVEGDGDLDLSVGNFDAPNKIYFNHNGILDRHPGWISQEQHDTRDIAWADVDGDGDLDLACADRGYSSFQPVVMYYNNWGILEQSASWKSSLPAGGGYVVWFDFDRDGDMDLFCSYGLSITTSQGTILVHVNRGDALDPVPDSISMGIYAYDDFGFFPSVDPDFYYLAYTNMFGFSLRRMDWPDLSGKSRLLTNSPPSVRIHKPIERIGPGNTFSIEFEVNDPDGNLCDVTPEYSLLGGGLWEAATVSGPVNRLANSQPGEAYQLTWDADADGVDGYNVAFRVRVRSNPDHAGLIAWPPQSDIEQIGRIDGRPHIALNYPRQGSKVADSLIVMGRIWDASNFDHFTFSLAPVSDTTAWQEVHTSSDPVSVTGIAGALDLRGFSQGEYLLRTAAVDRVGNDRIVDREFSLVVANGDAPHVVSCYPRCGQKDLPANVPVVVQFDLPMNQAFVNSRTLNLFSESGRQYKDVFYDYSTRTLTLDAGEVLEQNLYHYAIVDDQFQSATGITLGSEYVTGFTVGGKIPQPNMSYINPGRGETGLPPDISIAVKYAIPKSNLYMNLVSLSGDTVEILSKEYDPGSYLWTVTPRILQPRTYYIVHISDYPSFDDESDYVGYFVTADIDQPFVLDVLPSDQSWLVRLDSEIRAVFSKAINTHTVDSTSFYVTCTEGKVSGLIGFSGGGDSIITFTPHQAYQPGMEYTVHLTERVQDNIGNPVPAKSWRFVTGIFGTIEYNGGDLSALGAELIFPLGTVFSGTEIGLGRIPPEKIDGLEGLEFSGIAYDIEPVVDLTRKAILKITLPDSLSSGGVERFALYGYDSLDGSWNHVGGIQTGDCLATSINKLGRYGVFRVGEVDAAPADLEASLALLPRVISPRTGGVNGQLNISFRVAEATDVVARIYDTGGRLVKTLAAGSVARVGENLLSWDGRTDDGEFATDGLHVVVIEAAGQKAQKTFVILNK